MDRMQNDAPIIRWEFPLKPVNLCHKAALSSRVFESQSQSLELYDSPCNSHCANVFVCATARVPRLTSYPHPNLNSRADNIMHTCKSFHEIKAP